MPRIEDAMRAWEAKDYAAARAICTELATSDPAAAAEHYRTAAEAGHNVARYSLGALHAQGRGVAKDFAEALRWYRLAADGGYPGAMTRVGAMYAAGEGVLRDLAEAARWWEKAAAGGDGEAMQLVGRLYSDGAAGYPADPGLAAYWFFQAWQAGRDEAEQDIIRGRAALEGAAAAGSAAAQNALGLILCFGQDDPGEAAVWFDRAAAQDHPEALRMLAYLLHDGKGVEQDEAGAMELYRRAAEGGDGLAQFNYAIALDRGVAEVPRDVSAAIVWFRRAADRGVDHANGRLAELLAERNRDRRDANEAVQRLMKVAKAGPPDAEYRIAAGDGSWAVVIKDRGAVVAMPGLKVEELVGLPDDD